MPAARDLDQLYRDTIAVGEAARRWFDGPGLAWRATLPLAARAQVATESLAVTARLLTVMSWLLDPGHQAGASPPLTRIDPAGDPPLRPDHPLAGQKGGAISRQSRAIVARAEALAGL